MYDWKCLGFDADCITLLDLFYKFPSSKYELINQTIIVMRRFEAVDLFMLPNAR
jgi:hypothetical protein